MAPRAQIVSGLEEVGRADSVVAIGFFDGVHRGHQTIIHHAVRQAAQRGVRSVVVTFDRHPMEVIAPGSQPKLLMSLERRAMSIAEQGVDLVVVVDFDDALRHLEPAAFVDHVLVEPLQSVGVVVGTNFRFGHRAAGDVALLGDLGPARGFTVAGVSLLELDGEVISSTRVRAALDAGEVELAERMQGRPHLVDGVVVHGDARGGSIGFPTANLRVSERVSVPRVGVYAGRCRLADGSRVPCVTNVGVNPTFGGQELRVESHLLDWTGDLYGHTVSVEFSHRLRDEQRFDEVDALVAQIHRDIDTARTLLPSG